MTLPARVWSAWRVVATTFGAGAAGLATGVLFATLRAVVAVGMALDPLVFPALRRATVRAPIVVVGNPRTGTTFLQRWLCDHGVGAGQELWRMLYPSLALQAVLRPALPLLERLSPARHHSSAAHETSLTSVETDDVAVFFRYFDGFFLYGFLLAFDELDHRSSFEPTVRDTLDRDLAWLDALWRRSTVAHDGQRVVAKLFSLGPRLPAFLARVPDARVIVLIRDPLAVIPSTMSLVCGVLDKRFGFWSLPEEVRARYLTRLYAALHTLMTRFDEDWRRGAIDRTKVMIVPYPRLMGDFANTMQEILQFVGHEPDATLQGAMAVTDASQRAHKSEHRYDLVRFGLDEAKIRKDFAFVYDTWLDEGGGHGAR